MIDARTAHLVSLNREARRTADPGVVAAYSIAAAHRAAGAVNPCEQEGGRQVMRSIGKAGAGKGCCQVQGLDWGPRISPPALPRTAAAAPRASAMPRCSWSDRMRCFG